MSIPRNAGVKSRRLYADWKNQSDMSTQKSAIHSRRARYSADWKNISIQKNAVMKKAIWSVDWKNISTQKNAI
ncbi:hypothetical protein AALB51_08660 [Lachnospiraceae bacterium 62-26]